MRAFKHERAARGGAPAAPVNRGARRRGSWHVFCSSALAISLRSRVMVGDNEMGVRESLRAILHGECEVVTAASGEAALDAMARDPIDVMTLDLKMPGLGGIGVLERAKQIDPDLEVLIITGYGSLDTAVQGLRLRAFDYLSKPFDSAQVRRLVARAIARRAAMRRMNALPEQVLSGLSHELRTPLNVIMGYSAILREEGEDTLSAEQRLALDRIQSNSASLLAYVETILYMAELDRGTMPVARDEVRVTDLLGRLGAELAPRARAKGLGWRLDAPADLSLMTDEDKLARLLRALADNAVRYTAEGEVVVVARPAATGVTLEMRDSGPGIDPELIVETEDVLAGRAPTRPRRCSASGFGWAGLSVPFFARRLPMRAAPGAPPGHSAV